MMSATAESINPKIGITIGDINGIGPEVIIKVLRDSRITKYITPIIYGSTKVLSYYRKALNLEDFQYSQVKHDQDFNLKNTNTDHLKMRSLTSCRHKTLREKQYYSALQF